MLGLRALSPVREVVRPPEPGAARWHVFGVPDQRAALLAGSRDDLGPPVVAVVLRDRWSRADAGILLGAVARARHGCRRLVLLHAGAGGGSLLRAVAAEEPGLRVTSIEAPDTAPAMRSALAVAAAQPTAADDYRVDAAGRVTLPVWRRAAIPAAPREMAGARVLISGGLGGLGIRVAAYLAARCAVHPVLLDVRPPAQADTAGYLARLRQGPAGVTVLTADVTDPAQVAAALDRAGRAGIAGLVHCAGRVASHPGRDLTAGQLTALTEVKAAGLATLLSTLDTSALRFVVCFGSVMARCPHPGLAGYALANELLRREAERWSRRLPDCTVATAEWSLWSGAGMARKVARTGGRQLRMAPVSLRAGLRATGCLTAGVAPGVAASGCLVLAGEPSRPYPLAGDPAGAGLVALPGIDATLTTPAGGPAAGGVPDLVAQAVRACVPYGSRPVLESSVPGGGGLTVHAGVRGDRVHCEVRGDGGTLLYEYRFRLEPQGGDTSTQRREVQDHA